MPQEHTLRHAYLIAAHDKPAQLRTLLSLLNHPDNDIYLHIDRKATGFSESELRAAAPLSRVFFAPRLDARWGDEVFIDVIVSLLRMASTEEHAYYHLLSGADLPLQSQDEIHDFFAAHAGQEFVDFDRETVDAAMLRQRIGRWHMRQPVRPFAKKLYRVMEACWLDLQKLLRVDRLKHCPLCFKRVRCGSQLRMPARFTRLDRSINLALFTGVPSARTSSGCKRRWPVPRLWKSAHSRGLATSAPRPCALWTGRTAAARPACFAMRTMRR